MLAQGGARPRRRTAQRPAGTCSRTRQKSPGGPKKPRRAAPGGAQLGRRGRPGRAELRLGRRAGRRRRRGVRRGRALGRQRGLRVARRSAQRVGLRRRLAQAVGQRVLLRARARRGRARVAQLGLPRRPRRVRPAPRRPSMPAGAIRGAGLAGALTSASAEAPVQWAPTLPPEPSPRRRFPLMCMARLAGSGRARPFCVLCGSPAQRFERASARQAPLTVGSQAGVRARSRRRACRPSATDRRPSSSAARRRDSAASSARSSAARAAAASAAAAAWMRSAAAWRREQHQRRAAFADKRVPAGGPRAPGAPPA